MLSKHKAAAALLAILLAGDASCTPLIVARSGNHIIVATNSIDSDGDSRCKLHFSKSAVVLRATQAASILLTWTDGTTENVDFDAVLNDRIRDLDLPLDTLKDTLVQAVENRIKDVLQLYKPSAFDRTEIAQELLSEYVLVGKERSGFLGIRAFTLKVSDPQNITFDVHDITRKLHSGEIVDYSQGEAEAVGVHGRKSLESAIYALLDDHGRAAQKAGNKSFSPPYLVLDLTHSARSFLSDPGPCRLPR